jgi:biotin carboxyl carrier protein
MLVSESCELAAHRARVQDLGCRGRSRGAKRSPEACEGRPMATEVEAQIAGSVWKIERGVGDVVKEEDVLMILESMKMEIPVEAPCAGRIREIRVQEGQAIEEGTVLAVIE